MERTTVTPGDLLWSDKCELDPMIIIRDDHGWLWPEMKKKSSKIATNTPGIVVSIVPSRRRTVPAFYMLTPQAIGWDEGPNWRLDDLAR